MKLLFDQNLSRKLVNRLADIFPNSSHVQFHGLLEIMSNNPYYNLSVDEENIIIKIDKKVIDYQQPAQLLNHIELKSISQRSQLTEEAAAELANEIDSTVWSQVKSKLSRVNCDWTKSIDYS
ncbi:MAG: DUF5615 family PIN-like protein [Rhizonema sp. PD37]|nr:DUF5615 family PIN-like protein [Rhizonema sp. PD37]